MKVYMKDSRVIGTCERTGARIIGLTEEEARDLYNGHLALAHRLAADMAKKHRQLFDNVHEEALSILGETIANWGSSHYSSRYNPDKCSPTSWLYRRIYYGLLTWCERKQPKETTFTKMDATATVGRGFTANLAYKPGWLETVVRNLGEDARIVVTTIVNAPAEIAADIAQGAPARTGKAVRAYLTGQGWSPDRVAAAWAEVQVAL